MLALFDAWIDYDDPTYYIRRLDNWLHQFFGLPPECCEYREDCSNLVTIEWNGDVYPCDFFVLDKYRMGNVKDDTLEQMLKGKAFRSFVHDAESLPPMCEDCELLGVCHGGCFRHRAKLGIRTDEMPYLCEAKKRIFPHVFGRLRRVMQDGTDHPELHRFLNRIAREVAVGAMHAGAGHAPAPQAPPRRPAAARSGADAPRRNAPCPCGSGRKFKQCCGAKKL
jgi:uncharacterized protein